MKLDFKRSMTSGIESTEPAKPRSAKRRMMFIMLAGVLAIVGTLAAGY